MTIDELNKMPADEAEESFLECCGSAAWASKMAEKRPFKNLEALIKTADKIWGGLSEKDWKEAFAAHPRIGNIDSLRSRFVHTRKWASEEQSGVSSASETVLSLLAQGNRKYEERFGYIFVVDAGGKSAAQMLRLLKERLKNDPSEEIKIASGQQQQITAHRLRKMIDTPPVDG